MDESLLIRDAKLLSAFVDRLCENHADGEVCGDAVAAHFTSLMLAQRKNKTKPAPKIAPDDDAF